MNEIMDKEYARRPFLLAVGAILIIFAILRHYVIPDQTSTIPGGWLPFFATILDGLIASIFVTVGIALTIWKLTPNILKKSNIRIVEPKALKALFRGALQTSEIWWYKGGCGRFFRTSALPTMAKCAREMSHSREVRVCILNPLNEKTVKKHARHRSSTASGQAEEWTESQVRNELYATIVTTLLYQIEAPALRITLSLIPSYSAFRIDLSDDYAIITKEDREAPAIVCDRGTYFYKSYKDEIGLAESQGDTVPPLRDNQMNLSELTVANLKPLLEEVKLWSDRITTSDQEKIVNLIQNPVNPYA
ncbi:hypothetical protein [Marinobacter sp.]|uniref:hypothetical protein n=1 Tax=Marinobacter sp. TaxID=50741 RepID=UPI002352C4B0|nr:hypothetical protein [Marinobacter sp.]